MQNSIPKFLHEKDQHPKDMKRIEDLKIGEVSSKGIEEKN